MDLTYADYTRRYIVLCAAMVSTIRQRSNSRIYAATPISHLHLTTISGYINMYVCVFERKYDILEGVMRLRPLRNKLRATKFFFSSPWSPINTESREIYENSHKPFFSIKKKCSQHFAVDNHQIDYDKKSCLSAALSPVIITILKNRKSNKIKNITFIYALLLSSFSIMPIPQHSNTHTHTLFTTS